MYSYTTRGSGPGKILCVLCDDQVIFSKCIGIHPQTNCEVATVSSLEGNQLKIKEIHEFQTHQGKLVPIDIGSCIRCFYECCCEASDKLTATTETTWLCSDTKVEQIRFETDAVFDAWQSQQM